MIMQKHERSDEGCVNRRWQLFLPLLLFAASSYAQDVVLIRQTPLYERPTVEAETRATLPVGLKLRLNARQGEWLAVTTSEGLIGWIPRSAAHVEEPAAPSNAAPAPQDEASPAQAPPAQDRSAPPERAGQGLGFYNSKRRSALSFSMSESARNIAISWASLRGRRFEWGGYVNGTRYDIVQREFWYDLQVGGLINFFLMQPRGGSPLGLYGGGFLAFTQYYLGRNVPEDVNTLHYGGEAGAYLHLGQRWLLVPRAAVRLEKASYAGGDRPRGYIVAQGVAQEGTFTAFLVGLDVRLGSFVPGLWLMSRDGKQTFTLGAAFAF